jgi:hypothetical protein
MPKSTEVRVQVYCQAPLKRIFKVQGHKVNELDMVAQEQDFVIHV